MNNEVITHYLEDAIPNYMKSDYPAFHQLIKDMYSFINEDGDGIRILMEYKENQDIMAADESYIINILSDLGFTAFDKIKNKRLFAIFLLDFYASAGSPQSFRYLFKAMFDVDVKIEYPREQMMIPSQAEYYTDYYIYTSNDNINNDAFKYIVDNLKTIPAKAYGLSSKLEALIESIDVIYTMDNSYLRIGLFPPRYEFAKNEFVEITLGEYSFKENVKNVLKIIPKSPGNLYKLKDKILVTNSKIDGEVIIEDLTSGIIEDIEVSEQLTEGTTIISKSENGYGFAARQDGDRLNIYSHGFGYTEEPSFSIDGKITDIVKPKLKDVGGIHSLKITKPFIDFNLSDINVNIISENGSGFEYELSDSTLHIEQGYRNDIGFFGVNGYIHDSLKYQQFSYLIISEAMPSEYYKIIDEFLHPAGYVFFPVLELSYLMELGLSFESSYSIDEVPEYMFEEVIQIALTVNMWISIIHNAELSSDLAFNALNDTLDTLMLYNNFNVSIEDLGLDKTVEQIQSEYSKSVAFNFALEPTIEVIVE